jgi:hypothetical protein
MPTDTYISSQQALERRGGGNRCRQNQLSPIRQENVRLFGSLAPQMGHAPSPALATEAATRDGSALDAYSGRAHARAEVRSRHSQILVWAL